MKRRERDPLVRPGYCCGCKRDAVLYKIPGLFRYRCADCYAREVGSRHWLEPRT